MATLLRVVLLLFCIYETVVGQGVIWGEERAACETTNGVDGSITRQRTKIAIQQGRNRLMKLPNGNIGMVDKMTNRATGNMTQEFYLNHAPSSTLVSPGKWDRVVGCVDENGNQPANSRFITMADFADAVSKTRSIKKVDLPPYEIATADPAMNVITMAYTKRFCCVTLESTCGSSDKCDHIVHRMTVPDDQCLEARPPCCPISSTGVNCMK